MPNEGGRGNGKADHAWLDAQLEAGLLFAVEAEDRPPDCYYEFNYQWDGYASELDTSWYEPHFRAGKDHRCTGQAYIRDESGMYIADNDWQRMTRPCLTLPARGTTVCHAHGAKIPNVVAAAQRKLQEAAEIAADRLLRLTGTRDEENFKIRSQDRIAAISSVLDRAGVKGSTEIEVKASGFEGVLKDLFGGDDVQD
jgi:hypothetical protein